MIDTLSTPHAVASGPLEADDLRALVDGEGLGSLWAVGRGSAARPASPRLPGAPAPHSPR